MNIRLKDLIAPSFYKAHKELKKEKYIEYWFKGGRGSTKSSFISIEIILGLIRDREANAVVTRKHQNELRDTVYGQIQWAIRKMDLLNEFHFKLQPMEIILKKTGQKIIFKGADNPNKLKSINLGRGYVKFLWFEELDQFNGMEDIRNFKQSMFRGSDEHRIALFSYNPPKSQRSWVNRETKRNHKQRFIHHSTFLTVPQQWLGQTFIVEAETLKAYNPIAYEHEYLGKEVGTGLEVFNNLEIRRIQEEEYENFDYILQGLDFGFASDPMAFVKMHFDKTRKILYIFKEITGVKMYNEDLIDKLNKDDLNTLTYADSEAPKDIADLSRKGMNIRKARKPSGSRERGYKYLESLNKIVIDDRLSRTTKEFLNYTLEKDNSGETIPKYPKHDDHVIDAVRYALNDEIIVKKGFYKGG